MTAACPPGPIWSIASMIGGALSRMAGRWVVVGTTKASGRLYPRVFNLLEMSGL